MKIGFDVSQTGADKRGCGYFADSVIRQISTLDFSNQYLLYSTFGDKFWDPSDKKCNISRNNFKKGLSHSTLYKAKQFWQKLPLDVIEKRLGSVDILHANNFFCPPKFKNTKIVYTLYDLSFIDYPDYTTEANRLVCFDGVFQASLNADYIIAISNASRDRFLEIFPYYDAKRISVIHLASRFDRAQLVKKPSRFSHLPENQYWLNVGTIEPRKNQVRLLHAYAKLKAVQKNALPFVLAGGAGWMMESFQKEIAQLGLEKDVILTGYVSDVELQWLYANCFAFLYPSLYEGFGLPVLEAMSLNKPVITSNIAPITEITGDAAVLVDPLDEGAICQGMLSLTNNSDYYHRVMRECFERAKLFSWHNSATKMLSIYDNIYANAVQKVA